MSAGGPPLFAMAMIAKKPDPSSRTATPHVLLGSRGADHKCTPGVQLSPASGSALGIICTYVCSACGKDMLAVTFFLVVAL